jgi:hypothetical protein
MARAGNGMKFGRQRSEMAGGRGRLAKASSTAARAAPLVLSEVKGALQIFLRLLDGLTPPIFSNDQHRLVRLKPSSDIGAALFVAGGGAERHQLTALRACLWGLAHGGCLRALHLVRAQIKFTQRPPRIVWVFRPHNPALTSGEIVLKHVIGPLWMLGHISLVQLMPKHHVEALWKIHFALS